MYSKNNQHPEAKPSRIRLSNGDTRTNFDYTEEELLEAGYKYVGEMPTVDSSNVVEWDTTLGEWAVREKTSGEIQSDEMQQINAVVAQRNQLLKESDWTQLADAFAGETHPQIRRALWNQYRYTLKLIKREMVGLTEMTFPLPPTETDVLRASILTRTPN